MSAAATNFLFQLAGSLLTVASLAISVGQPMFNRLDNVALTLARVDERSKTSDSRITALEERYEMLIRQQYNRPQQKREDSPR
jgi:chromosome segregation and condensation protein ScpB